MWVKFRDTWLVTAFCHSLYQARFQVWHENTKIDIRTERILYILYIKNCAHIYGLKWRIRSTADCLKSFRTRERGRGETWAGLQIRILMLKFDLVLFGLLRN